MARTTILPGAHVVPVEQGFMAPGSAGIAAVRKHQTEPLPRVPARVVAAGKTRLCLEVADAGWHILSPAPGVTVRIYQQAGDRMAFLEAKISQAEQGASPNLIVAHGGKALDAERRLFHRFGIRKRFFATEIILPDGRTAPLQRLQLLDLGTEGIGFKSWRKLPAGTCFAAQGLFGPEAEDLEKMIFGFKVVWHRRTLCAGVRHGATFTFASGHEQYRYVETVNRLQSERLLWLYRTLIEPPTASARGGK